MNNKFNNFQEIFQTETVDVMAHPCNVVSSNAILAENLFLVRQIFVLDQRAGVEDSVEDGWEDNSKV